MLFYFIPFTMEREKVIHFDFIEPFHILDDGDYATPSFLL